MSFTVRAELNNVTVGTLVTALQEIERLFSQKPVICDCTFEIDEQTTEELLEVTLEALEMNEGRQISSLFTEVETHNGMIYLTMNSWNVTYSFSVESHSLEICKQVISILKRTFEPINDTLLASEKSLAKDWLSAEEDEVWKHLNQDAAPAIPSDIEMLRDGLIKEFNLQRIILFGSYANGTATIESNIDLCIIVNVPDIDELERKINFYIYDPKGLNFQRSVDVITYTPKQWEENVKAKGSLARHIAKTGVVLF